MTYTWQDALEKGGGEIKEPLLMSLSWELGY
jgi:hypothetical protein